MILIVVVSCQSIIQHINIVLSVLVRHFVWMILALIFNILFPSVRNTYHHFYSTPHFSITFKKKSQKHFSATAPGKARSPEEYSYQNLTEKLDIYALANVLYEILTGKRAWYEYGTTETKNMIMQGIKPNVALEEIQQQQTTTLKVDSIDEALFQLMLQAYELNATQRSSATKLLTQMEALAEKFNITLY